MPRRLFNSTEEALTEAPHLTAAEHNGQHEGTMNLASEGFLDGKVSKHAPQQGLGSNITGKGLFIVLCSVLFIFNLPEGGIRTKPKERGSLFSPAHCQHASLKQMRPGRDLGS